MELTMHKTQALRDLVVQRLVFAADEIFALFEQTFAQYQLEYQQVLMSNLLQDHKYHVQQEGPKEDQQTGDVQTVMVQTDVQPNLRCIKYEEEEIPLDLQFHPLNAQSEENINQATYFKQEPAEKHGQEAIGVKYDGEESDESETPGSSLDSDKDFAPCSNSETDNSEDWEPTPKKKRASRKRNNGLGSNKQKDNEDIPNQPLIALKDKLFSCPVCHKGFAGNYYLKAHMRIHTGEKPFRCEPCGLSFAFQQNYRQHNFTYHQSEKPYKCRVCDQRFADKSELNGHQETHKDKEPYKCLNCNKTFMLFKNLMAHKMSERCF